MSGMPDTTVTRAAGLRPGSAAALAVERRLDIFTMTQAAEDAVLSPADAGGLGHGLRHALAARIAAINGAPDLAARYAANLRDPGLAALAVPGGTSADARLQAMLAFTDSVASAPKDVVAGDVTALQAAGISDADIVRLAELNAFLAYQLRLIAGLRLMMETPA